MQQAGRQAAYQGVSGGGRGEWCAWVQLGAGCGGRGEAAAPGWQPHTALARRGGGGGGQHRRQSWSGTHLRPCRWSSRGTRPGRWCPRPRGTQSTCRQACQVAQGQEQEHTIRLACRACKATTPRRACRHGACRAGWHCRCCWGERASSRRAAGREAGAAGTHRQWLMQSRMPLGRSIVSPGTPTRGSATSCAVQPSGRLKR